MATAKGPVATIERCIVPSWRRNGIGVIRSRKRRAMLPSERRIVDCADPADACLVHVFATADVEATSTRVPLDVAPPPAPPASRGVVDVEPATGLSGGDLLTVTGGGFRPGALVDLYRCEAGTTDRASCERLLTGTGVPASVVADGSGDLAPTTVRMPPGTGLVAFGSTPPAADCLYGTCAVAAAEAVDFVGTVTHAPISYAAPPRRIVPSYVVLTEGDDGTVVAEVPVSLSGPSNQVVTAEWVTLYGPGVEPPAPAEPGVDFTAASGTVTFAPGETSATIEIVVAGDLVAEPTEYVVVSVRNPTNASMGGFWGLGFAVVVDDD